MSKTIQRTACFYLPHEDVRRLDELRGIISRSKMGVIAVKRLIADIETGKLVLPSEIKTPTTTEKGERARPRATSTNTYTDSYSVTPTTIGVTTTKTQGESKFS